MFNDEIKAILLNFAKSERCTIYDIDIYVFPQIWGNTSLGYNGIGGQAMTKSYTIVFINPCTNNILFSYGGKFIKLENVNNLFFEDLRNCNIKPENELYKYRGDKN